MNMITLSDGTVVADVVVSVVLVALRSLIDDLTGALALYELVELAKNPRHNIFSEPLFVRLQEAALVEGTFKAPRLRVEIRAIVNTCVKFEDLNVSITPPDGLRSA